VGVDLARLVVGAVVRMPGAGGPVRLISVEPGSFWSFVYEHADGLARITLSEEELAEIELLDVARAPTFDGDPEQFRLGLEARRIKTTFTYEMAAVAVSNIRPLPHQLEAVYDEFLTQPRLRFLLADDPGAGKTIMAGLYAKELVLRRSGDRILLVVPANLRPQWVRELDECFQLSFVDMAAVFEASPNENPDGGDRVTLRFCLDCGSHHQSGYSCPQREARRYRTSAARRARGRTPGVWRVKQHDDETASGVRVAARLATCRSTT
jgi:hypothetical protein